MRIPSPWRLLLLAVLAAAPAAQAQRIFPQQTGWGFSRSSGNGSFTSQTVRLLSVARVPEVAGELDNVEVFIGPDGNYDYRILDPTLKFGSVYQSQTIEQTEITDGNGINVIGDFGYSVFRN